MKKLRELAEANGVKTSKRLFTENRETGKPVFFDVQKTRAQLVDELRELGVL